MLEMQDAKTGIDVLTLRPLLQDTHFREVDEVLYVSRCPWTKETLGMIHESQSQPAQKNAKLKQETGHGRYGNITRLWKRTQKSG